MHAVLVLPVRALTLAETKRIKKFPNIGPKALVVDARKTFGNDAFLVKFGDYIYNVDRSTYSWATARLENYAGSKCSGNCITCKSKCRPMSDEVNIYAWLNDKDETII